MKQRMFILGMISLFGSVTAQRIQKGGGSDHFSIDIMGQITIILTANLWE